MTAQTPKKNRKKSLLLTVLGLTLVACVTVGTMAWLTAQDSLTNTFTVGNFNKPDTTNPETPDPQPDVDPEKPNVSLGGYIIEPSWDVSEGAEHKLVPGGSLYKDPYVGIGKGSEDAVVYVYVSNPFLNSSVYFQLNDAWQAVDGQTTAGPSDGTYVSGLFKYVGEDSSGILKASEDTDSWTSRAVFTQVIVSDGAATADLNIEGAKDIEVSCFIHQATSGDGEAIDATTIQNAAIAALVPTSEP